jgi:cation diffusion facilitator family transporter
MLFILSRVIIVLLELSMSHNHVHNIKYSNEKKTLIVIIVTVITMVAEIVFGYITNSMALLADGFHMGTHALALGLTFVAYVLIRKLKNSLFFPNGTDKIGTLAAYTSSIFLGLTGFWIIFEAIVRLIKPISIHFDEAIIVAIIGLLVNASCILIMEKGNDGHNKLPDSSDYNFMAAYYHILADALTSVFAIAALFAGKYLHIFCLDALVGILGGILILRWTVSLLKQTTPILIDMKKQ